MKKKLFAILLSLAMVVTMMPAMAFADIAESPTEIDETLETKGASIMQDFQSQPGEDQQSVAKSEGDVTDDEALLSDSVQNSLEANPNGRTYKLTERTSKLSDNCTYIVEGRVYNNNRVYVSGTANIVLSNGCHVVFSRGICVERNNKLTISGNGELIAYGENNCAGIGGRNRGFAGTICIEGGVIRAQGGWGAAGIGGGNDGGGGGIITIKRGNVTAIGGQYGAGIGGGNGGYGGHKTIEGGIVNAQGGQWASGIGGGSRGNSDGIIQINNGTVTAQGGSNGAGIGGGKFGNCTSKITITNGKVTAIGGDERIERRGGGAGIGGGQYGNVTASITISGGEVNATGGGTTLVAAGLTFINGAAGIGGGSEGSCNQVTIKNAKVITKGGRGGAGIGGGAGRKVDKVTIENANVTANGGIYGAGIGGGSGSCGANITINGGIVNAEGGSGASGIGNASNGHGSNVTIRSGDVTAKGGRWAAGIGGGGIANDELDSITITGGGNEKAGNDSVTINGGTVKANGGYHGAGIGGGEFAEGFPVLITGGNVTAQGGNQAAGIGGGNGFKGGETTIRGGTVIARGGWCGSGIGGGRRGAGAPVIIYGGTVTATGGDLASGIGGGSGGNGSSVKIYGGIVTANGGDRARCIGRGSFGQIGTFELRKGLSVFDISREGSLIEINDPTANKLDKVKKVLIRTKSTRIAVEPKVVSKLVYNHSLQDGFINIGRNVHLYGDIRAKNVGTYTLIARPEPGFVWSDYTNHPKYYKWSIIKRDYSGVTKTVSAEVEAKAGSNTTITLPDIPTGTRYGTPRKKFNGDPYELTNIKGKNITFILSRDTAKDSMVFIVPVLADSNHNGYDITVTVKTTHSFKVQVDVTRDYGGLRLYHATISAVPKNQVADISYSLTGLFYTSGTRITSLTRINHFYICIIGKSGKKYYYEYLNGQVYEI